MLEKENHTCHYLGELLPGYDEFHCPICGYHTLIRWPPDYDKIILAEGSPNATHSGGKGGLTMSANFNEVLGEDDEHENFSPDGE